MAKNLSVIILAAGKGTRMNSPLPKVLHPVAGIPLISYVMSSIKSLEPKEIRTVVGHAKQLVQSMVEPMGAQCFVQEKQLGTGHAVQAAQPESLEGDVLILNGDHPLIQSEDLQKFYQNYQDSKADLALMTAELTNPGSYGRIVRQGNQVRAIVEARHAGKETLNIKEVNTGIYLIKAELLKDWIKEIEMNPEKEEFYFTDIVETSFEQNAKLIAVKSNPRVAFGVNTQAELANASKSIYNAKAKALMNAGVIIVDPEKTYIEATVQVGAGTVIYPNVFIKGLSQVGFNSVIEPNVFMVNSVVKDSCQIRAGSYLEECEVSEKCVIGPYARLRPETEIAEGASIGNFVELKKVKFGAGSKANHLTYLGDADIGKNVNIGCGTITCNYAADRKKYKTTIDDDAFIGSDSQFVAPINVGKQAVIGSGSTITKDVPDRALAVARGKQFIKENYVPSDED